MSDDEEKETCVVVLIGNDDEDLELARACARRLGDVLKYTKMFSGHPVCGDPILLLDKCKEEIMEGIQKAVQLVKDHDASWLTIYYAGHAFWDDLTKEILIKPKLADGDGIWLKKQVKKTVDDAELEYIKATIFMDSCLEEPLERLDAAKGDNQPGDLKKLPGNKFEVVQSCKAGESIRDGWLFARAIERCAQKPLVDQLQLVSHVEELAWQLSFHRLCPWRSGMPGLEGIKDMVLTEKQRKLFKITHFLRFALDLWTEDKLELDPKKDWLELEGSDIKETVKFLKRIAKEFETKRAAFEKPWCELEAIVKCYSLNHFEEYLKKLEISVRDVSELDPENVLIPENVRRAIVEVLQEKVPKVDPENPKFTENGDPDFQWEGLHTLRGLMQDLVLWYQKWEPQASETGISFILDEEKKDKKAYSVVVKDLDVENLQESERNELADEINRLCKDLGIPGRVYLVPGSLWIIFCLKDELSRDCRRKFAASLKSWIYQQKQSGANGWTLAQDPCWKPLYAVPDRILDLVRQVESLCGSCLPTNPTECMWLRASDLRNLVAKQLNAMRERTLEKWRVVVFEGLMERRGDSWLQGTGTLGCCFLPHFEDERLDHQMQEIANLACKRKQSMRPEVQALVFLLQRAQLELTDEEWTQVVDSARVCYERLKTALRKLMLDKDTDLICEMNDIADDSDWEFVDPGRVKDSENPSGSNGRDAAAAATATSNSSSSEFKALGLCDDEAEVGAVPKLEESFADEISCNDALRLADEWMGSGKSNEALKLCKSGLSSEFVRTSLQYTCLFSKRLSDCYQKLEQYSDAESVLLEMMQRCEEIDPWSPLYANIVCNLGFLYQRSGSWSDAEKRFRQSLDICEEHWMHARANCLFGLAGVLMELGKLEDALPLWRKSLELFTEINGMRRHKDNVDCLNGLATCLRRLGQVEEALQIYFECADIDQKDATIYQ